MLRQYKLVAKERKRVHFYDSCGEKIDAAPACCLRLESQRQNTYFNPCKPPFMKKTKDELIAMVDSVMKSSACMVDFDALMGPLEKQFPGVDIGKLIFDPPSGKRMKAEEIVDEALQSGGESANRRSDDE